MTAQRPSEQARGAVSSMREMPLSLNVPIGTAAAKLAAGIHQHAQAVAAAEQSHCWPDRRPTISGVGPARWVASGAILAVTVFPLSILEVRHLRRAPVDNK